jgi:hypothetical protein
VDMESNVGVGMRIIIPVFGERIEACLFWGHCISHPAE